MRRFASSVLLQFKNAARAVGLTPRRHQALLAIKGFPVRHAVTVGDLAERLRIRHHSAVELVACGSSLTSLPHHRGAKERRSCLRVSKERGARMGRNS
jgi:hypothetical protein